MDRHEGSTTGHGPGTSDADAPRLECGADYDELVTQVAERRAAGPERAAHQRGCPYCRATIAELEALWAPVTAMAGEQVRAPAGLVEAVMARVRELPRHTSWAQLATDGRGTTRLAARALGAIARRAAVEVPGVTAAIGGGSRRGGDAPGRGTAVGVSGSHVVVEVALEVAAGTAIPAVAAQVRRDVIERVAQLTDLTVTAVDVAVVDLSG